MWLKIKMDLLATKRKKTRRGKKVPKLTFENMENWAACGCAAEDQESRLCQDFTLITDASGPDLLMTAAKKISKKSMKKRIRPNNSPRAPPNSNQFLIDDRLGVAQLKKNMGVIQEDIENDYFNGPIGFPDEGGDQCIVPDNKLQTVDLAECPSWNTSPAYSDVDYTYKAFPDVDMLTFQEQEFEQAFREAQEEELSETTKPDLIVKIKRLEETVATLQQHIGRISQKTTPEVDLELELAQLRKKNQELREENTLLMSTS